ADTPQPSGGGKETSRVICFVTAAAMACRAPLSCSLVWSTIIIWMADIGLASYFSGLGQNLSGGGREVIAVGVAFAWLSKVCTHCTTSFLPSCFVTQESHWSVRRALLQKDSQPSTAVLSGRSVQPYLQRPEHAFLMQPALVQSPTRRKRAAKRRA